MKILGMQYSTNSSGERVFTIHGSVPFDNYYKNPESGRGCTGEKAESVYVGTYDCSALKVGMEIEILYDKAIKTSKGTFQPVKRIDILNK